MLSYWGWASLVLTFLIGELAPPCTGDARNVVSTWSAKTAQLFAVAPWELQNLGGSDEASSPSTATSGSGRKRAAKRCASMSIFWSSSASRISISFLPHSSREMDRVGYKPEPNLFTRLHVDVWTINLPSGCFAPNSRAHAWWLNQMNLAKGQ